MDELGTLVNGISADTYQYLIDTYDFDTELMSMFKEAKTTDGGETFYMFNDQSLTVDDFIAILESLDENFDGWDYITFDVFSLMKSSAKTIGG